MDFLGNIPLLVLLLMTGAGAILVKDLIGAVFILGSYSFFLALAWAWLGAVDVAFTEAVVGAGLSTVFFLLTLFHTTPAQLTGLEARPPWQAVVGLGLLGALLLYGATDLPALGDPAPVDPSDGAARTRFLDAICQAIGVMGAPMVMCVDNLHWLDSASLELVGYLAQIGRAHV